MNFYLWVRYENNISGIDLASVTDGLIEVDDMFLPQNQFLGLCFGEAVASILLLLTLRGPIK